MPALRASGTDNHINASQPAPSRTLCALSSASANGTRIDAVARILDVQRGPDEVSAHSDWVRMFRNAGYPDWFRIVIGIIVIMIGVLGTVAMTMHGQTFRFLPASLVLVIAVIVMRARWKRRIVPAGDLAAERG